MYVWDYRKTHSHKRNIWKIQLSQLSFSSCVAWETLKREPYPQETSVGFKGQKRKQELMARWMPEIAQVVIWEMIAYCPRKNGDPPWSHWEGDKPCSSIRVNFTLCTRLSAKCFTSRGPGEFPFIRPCTNLLCYLSVVTTNIWQCAPQIL